MVTALAGAARSPRSTRAAVPAIIIRVVMSYLRLIYIYFLVSIYLESKTLLFSDHSQATAVAPLCRIWRCDNSY